MGGNALKKFPTKRMTPSEYQDNERAVLGILRSHGLTAQGTHQYRNKESFGDIDIIYYGNKVDVASMFPMSREIIPNGDVVSLEFNGAQVDLIRSTPETFDYQVSYTAWSDLGNLIGRIAHKFGLKHGHDGLHYLVRSKDHVLATIQVTLDHDQTLDFLGLDSKKFRDGFDSLEDIFWFAMSSPYFNPTIYSFENLNAVSRIRDKKRSTYNAFLKFIDGLDPQNFYQFHSDKSTYLPRIFETFPHVGPLYQVAWAKKLLVEESHQRFNGVLVSEWTGLTGPALGNVMRSIKTILNHEKIVSMTSQEIFDFVIEFSNGQTTLDRH
jgi:hypothetical protein